MRSLPYEASVYRETAAQILMLLSQQLRLEESRLRETHEDAATLIDAIQYLNEIAVIADEERREQDIKDEAQRRASLVLMVVA